ncbi:xylose isomerase [Pseudarthrobacter sulfonivorans]|uniref:Xylose isomerase n=1 Tax=Pseudarthrobacter sulfonivorans TaxID=121292 RepID=A0A0U3FC83_9MICC|nr:sugar phosphate isomerase/epimerase family protein [Pseudarthrobacter sulfonivorans]ALV41433.1 xylose isomerase [Pseudarthrobacter sulfonivorans]
MKYSVFTASTPEWTPQETATMLARQGWDGVEWRITDQKENSTPGFWAGNKSTWPMTRLEENLETMASVTRSASLEFSGLGSYVTCSEHEDVERILAATACLGAKQVRILSQPLGTATWGGRPASGIPARNLFEQARQDFQWIAQRAEHYGVKALLELHQWTIAPSASAALRLLDGLNPRHVGVIHDLGNLVIEGQEDYFATFELLGDYLAHIHVKNAVWKPIDNHDTDLPGVIRWGYAWAPLKKGQASVEDYFTALNHFGYDGWVTVEDFSTELSIDQRTADNLAYLKAVAKASVQAH